MALRGRLRPPLTAALSAALVPALVAHVALGAAVGAAWWLARRPRLTAEPPLVAPIVGVACVLAAHPTELATTVVRWLALGLAAAALLAFRSGLDGRRPQLVGAAAAATAALLAVWAVLDGLRGGFGQVHPATYHPNLTAALGVALAGAAALAARRGDRWGRALADGGMLAGIALVVLTGSRSGLVGLAFAVLGLGIVGLAARAVRDPARSAALAVALGLVATTVLQVAAFEPATMGFERPATAIATSGTTVDPGANGTLAVRVRSLLDPWRGSGARVANWRVGRALASDRPLFGYGFDEALPTYGAATEARLMVANDHPHNSSLLVLLQGGTVLLVPIAVAALGLAWALARRAVGGDAVAARLFAAGLGLLAADRFDLLLADPRVAGVLLIGIFAALHGAAPAAPRATKERT